MVYLAFKCLSLMRDYHLFSGSVDIWTLRLTRQDHKLMTDSSEINKPQFLYQSGRCNDNKKCISVGDESHRCADITLLKVNKQLIPKSHPFKTDHRLVWCTVC